MFHICSSIREFGAINGYTTETYESLHKDHVKKPYKLTNKKEIDGWNDIKYNTLTPIKDDKESQNIKIKMWKCNDKNDTLVHLNKYSKNIYLY